MERAERSGTEEEDDLSWGDEENSDEEKAAAAAAIEKEEEADNLDTTPTNELNVKSVENLKLDEKSNNPPSNSSESPVMVQENNKNNNNSSDTTNKSAAKEILESDDWEKEFDIDMTEEEIAKALKNNEGQEEENLDDWD